MLVKLRPGVRQDARHGLFSGLARKRERTRCSLLCDSLSHSLNVTNLSGKEPKTKTREAAGYFHDGKAAFHLQAGAWVLTAGRLYSADKQGLLDAKLGWFFFPEVQGGSG